MPFSGPYQVRWSFIKVSYLLHKNSKNFITTFKTQQLQRRSPLSLIVGYMCCLLVRGPNECKCCRGIVGNKCCGWQWEQEQASAVVGATEERWYAKRTCKSEMTGYRCFEVLCGGRFQHHQFYIQCDQRRRHRELHSKTFKWFARIRQRAQYSSNSISFKVVIAVCEQVVSHHEELLNQVTNVKELESMLQVVTGGVNSLQLSIDRFSFLVWFLIEIRVASEIAEPQLWLRPDSAIITPARACELLRRIIRFCIWQENCRHICRRN